MTEFRSVSPSFSFGRALAQTFRATLAFSNSRVRRPPRQETLTDSGALRSLVVSKTSFEQRLLANLSARSSSGTRSTPSPALNPTCKKGRLLRVGRQGLGTPKAAEASLSQRPCPRSNCPELAPSSKEPLLAPAQPSSLAIALLSPNRLASRQGRAASFVWARGRTPGPVSRGGGGQPRMVLERRGLGPARDRPSQSRRSQDYLARNCKLTLATPVAS